MKKINQFLCLNSTFPQTNPGNLEFGLAYIPDHYSMKQKEKETLNELQVEAVTSPFTSPLLVVAGPGTGKTKVIVERIKHMVKNGIIDPMKVVRSAL